MRCLHPGVVLVAVILTTTACSGGSDVAPPPSVAALPAGTPPTTAPTGAPALASASAEPTVLTEAQRARDKALAPKAAAIVDAFYNDATGLMQLTRDKKRVLFSSTRDGSTQAYIAEIGKPAAPPKALTTGPERADGAWLTRDDKFVLFQRDEGADENYRLYRVGLDGSGTTLLTPGPKLHRDGPVLPLAKPDTMIYTAHDPASPASQLVVQTISSGEPKTVYTDTLPAYAVDATPDGTHALLIRWVSSSELVVVDVDVASGKARRLYPAEGKKEAVTTAVYSADGKSVYLTTDEGGESLFVLRLDASSGAEKARYQEKNPATATAYGMQASPKGDLLSVTIDAGDHTELRLLDAKALTPKAAVKTPLGWIAAGAFSLDGTSFVISESIPDRPVDLFVVDAATGAVKPVRDDKRPGLEGLPAIATSVEKVRAFDALSIPVNLYLPKLDAPKKLPTLVLIHGGPSWSSHVRWNPNVRFFVSIGYAVVEPNVRGSTGFGRAYEMGDDREKRGDALKDLESVNAWAKSQSWCDKDRVVVSGGSYGGYMTLMAVTRQPSIWRAGVDLFGIADLKTFLKSTDQAIRSGFVREFGDLDKDAALLEQYSPMRDADKIVAPLFVYAGQNDPRVPRSESDIIVRAMRGRGRQVEYMVAANEGHSLDRRENKIEFMTRAARFLEDAMR